MRSIFFVTALCAGALALGCNPADDTTTGGQVGEMQRGTPQDDAEAAYEVAMQRIESEHEAALRQCETLQAEAQDQCREAADARREAAEREAEAQRERATM
ncbi:MAG TPA: hypothetical protein VIN04_09855 [Myxococcota bacterium]